MANSLRYTLVFTRLLPVCGYNTKHIGAVTANDMHDKKVKLQVIGIFLGF